MPAKHTLETFTAKAVEIHGNRYAYLAISNPAGRVAKVLASCAIHGPFFSRFSDHLFKKSGCPDCGREELKKAKTLTFEDFLEKAKAVHGNRYKYLGLRLVNGKSVVAVVCPEHGEWNQSASQHLFGKGCKLCGNASGAEKRSKAPKIPLGKSTTLESFSTIASELHNSKYTYQRLIHEKATLYVEATCPSHGSFRLRARHHINGVACMQCGREKTKNAIAMTLEEVEAKARLVHGNKYRYLRLRSTKAGRMLDLVCPEHGEITQNMFYHVKGHGCNLCGNKKIQESNRDTLEQFVAKAREIHGDTYEYLSLDYSSRYTKIRFNCPTHGEQIQSTNTHLSAEAGCYWCGSARGGEANRTGPEDFKQKSTDRHGDKYTYEGLSFEDGDTYTRYSCPSHGQVRQLAWSHLKGSGCRKCGHEKVIEGLRDSLESFTEKAEQVHGQKYVYLKIQPINGAGVVSYLCSKHGFRVQNARAHLAGSGCASCGGRISKPSLAIADYLEGLDANPEMEFRFDGTKKFFDITLHKAKIAIEYNGNYWHSSERTPSSAHLEKTRIAESNGYRCIHIRSDEWENKRTAVEYLLKSAAGKVSEKVHARKTQVVKPSKLEASRMLDTYHIQGSVAYGEFYGLEEDGQLVAVMVFSRNTSSRREKASDSHVELTRYVTCKQVVGGFTKLLNAFLKDNPEVLTVSSYSDVRIFQGGVYEKAGFAKMHTTPPDYMYLEGDTLYHKANYQKSKLAKRFGAAACEGKTERQITEEQGIYRVYDCGKVKWLYTRK